MMGHLFSAYVPKEGSENATFEQLFKIFQELILASGDVAQAMAWLNELDIRYHLTNDQYGIGDFFNDLEEKGYLKKDQDGSGKPFRLEAKMEQSIRKSALDEIFGKLRRSKSGGNHPTPFTGSGDELSSDPRKFEFGDTLDQISMPESVRNALVNHGIGDFTILESDLQVLEKEQKSTTATVIMIDISHSMILYGEDRITPAKKVALALAELIRTKYPKDSLDLIVFGNDAWEVPLSDLPYLQVGPFHTNTVAGLELAMDLLRRKKTRNKQIFMITDGKPTCLKEGIKYYKNAFGLDRKILNKTLTLASQCRRLDIPVTTFMIASDPYLQQFVRTFTKVNNGRAYYSNLDRLGSFVLEDFQKNRRKNVK